MIQGHLKNHTCNNRGKWGIFFFRSFYINIFFQYGRNPQFCNEKFAEIICRSDYFRGQELVGEDGVGGQRVGLPRQTDRKMERSC